MRSIGFDVDEYNSRREAIEAIYASITQRQKELKELSAQSRTRREQVREQRQRLGDEMALRRMLVNHGGRAAVAILEAAVGVAEISMDDLWVDYFALGGAATAPELADMLAGRTIMSRQDHDRVAVALNEHLAQAGLGRPLAFWDGSR